MLFIELLDLSTKTSYEGNNNKKYANFTNLCKLVQHPHE